MRPTIPNVRDFQANVAEGVLVLGIKEMQENKANGKDIPSAAINGSGAGRWTKEGMDSG